MSVLIRGMEMPKRCGLCPCARSVDSVDWYCWQCTATEKVLNKFDVQESRPQHCPLVEVKTPHGRLIDADLAMEKLATDKREAYTKHDVWLKFSTYGASTVLEPEE